MEQNGADPMLADPSFGKVLGRVCYLYFMLQLIGFVFQFRWLFKIAEVPVVVKQISRS